MYIDLNKHYTLYSINLILNLKSDTVWPLRDDVVEFVEDLKRLQYVIWADYRSGDMSKCNKGQTAVIIEIKVSEVKESILKDEVNELINVHLKGYL